MNIDKQVSLNLNVRGLTQSATLAVNDLSSKLKSEGKTVYRLGLGQSPFPVPVCVVDALKHNAHENAYLPVKGLRELRGAVAEYHRKKDCVEAHPNLVIIGPGSKELMFLLQMVFYGELLVPTPCWVSYVPQAKILGKQVRLIHTHWVDKWRVTAESLQKFCDAEHDDYRPRILVLNYPGNPDGCTYTEHELRDLAEVARKYKLILLSDEIYGQLHHKGEHISIARFYPEGTIISSGLSKWCGAGGWRLGTFTFPPDLNWLLEAMAVAASETYTSVCAPVQYAAVRAFKGGVTIERYLWHARRILATLGNRCARMLKNGGINVHPPEGGFYLFPDFNPLKEKLTEKGISDGETLCRKLLEDTGVAVLPGSSFERPESELTTRIAYVDFDGAKALTASETIPLDKPLPEKFTDSWCHGIIQAIQLIVDWVNA